MDKKEQVTKKVAIDLNSLKSEALVGEPIKREVTWVNGDVENVFNVYIKPSDYYSVVNEFHGVAATFCNLIFNTNSVANFEFC